jgi:hypothetical protein
LETDGVHFCLSDCACASGYRLALLVPDGMSAEMAGGPTNSK